jgi:uncharacterized protein YjlB
VGTIHSGGGIEAVWVWKQDELVDSGWFSQVTVDLILVLQGSLRVEFAGPDIPDVTMRPGEILVLPPGMQCRAYRWPRDATQATIFLAAYPKPDGSTVRGP